MKQPTNELYARFRQFCLSILKKWATANLQLPTFSFLIKRIFVHRCPFVFRFGYVPCLSKNYFHPLTRKAGLIILPFYDFHRCPFIFRFGYVPCLPKNYFHPLTRKAGLSILPFLSSSEVIEANHVVFYTERVEKVEHGLCHHWRTAEVVLDIFWILVLLEIGVAHHWCHESRRVLDSSLVCLRVWTVEGEVEVEVVELLVECEEVVEERNLLEGTCSLEVVHLAVACVEGLEHVHDLCTERSHTGTTADPNHLTTSAVLWTELSVRT